MTREDLKSWMTAHGYTTDMLATELGLSFYTVDSWLRPSTSAASRAIPPYVEKFLALLEQKDGGDVA